MEIPQQLSQLNKVHFEPVRMKFNFGLNAQLTESKYDFQLKVIEKKPGIK
jgi:hypothetical protein